MKKEENRAGFKEGDIVLVPRPSGGNSEGTVVEVIRDFVCVRHWINTAVGRHTQIDARMDERWIKNSSVRKKDD